MLSFFFSLVLNIIVFVFNGLKQSLILLTKPNCLYRFLFFIGTLFMLIFKKAYCALCGQTWVEFAAMLVISRGKKTDKVQSFHLILNWQ